MVYENITITHIYTDLKEKEVVDKFKKLETI